MSKARKPVQGENKTFFEPAKSVVNPSRPTPHDNSIVKFKMSVSSAMKHNGYK